MKLLFVDDEPRIQEIVQNGLSEENFEVVGCSTAEDAMTLVLNTKPGFDAFLLDVLLPGLNGLDLCRWLRDMGHKEPIVMLTAKGALDERITGLDAGADDYLAKPFEVAELKARFRAMFRKVQGYPRDPMMVADLFFDPNTRSASRSGIPLELSKKEASLLEYLMKNTHRVVTRSMIANAVWDTETNQYTNVIDVFINHLRKKVDLPGQPRLVHTVRGKGFRLTSGLEQEE